MKRTRFPHLTFAMLAMVFLLTFSFLQTRQAAAKPILKTAELEEIRQEISLLNLLRGLYLTKDQINQMLILAEKAREIRESMKKSFEADEESILSTFADLRESLYLDPGKEKVAQEKAKVLDKRIKDAVGNSQDRIFALEQEAATVLTLAQISILEDFKPCLIPPKDFQNPVRVGQAAGDGGLTAKLADLIHATPRDVWKERGSLLIQNISDKMEIELGMMSPEMKSDTKRRLEKISQKVLDCSDVDYVLKRHALAGEFLLINSKKALKHGHKKTGEVARWLLSDNACKVLPRWLKTLGNPSSSEIAQIDEELPVGASTLELGAKATELIKKLYNQRKNTNSLPSLKELNVPIKEASEKGDRNLLADVTLKAIDRLVAVKADPPAVRALAQIARQISHGTGFPLLNPNHDPYGFSADLRASIDNGNPAHACRNIRVLIDTLRRFKPRV